jgi:predicted N-acetyltransferase YhbS
LNLDLVAAEGAILDEILAATFDIWHEGLSRRAYARYYSAQRATPWGRAHLRRWALVDGAMVLSSAKLYQFSAVLDGRPIRVIGLGAVFTPPAHRGHGYARMLIDRLLQRATAAGVDMALLFSEIDPDYYHRLGFVVVPRSNLLLRVVESDRRGAPATLVRAGEERDLDAVVDMGRARASRYRLYLDRDRDVVHFALAKKRLLAGQGPAGEREVHFFVAEEGASAAAYVVITARGGAWTIEEAGDRDPSGARLGAILQTLIARDPAERRPSIGGWLPSDFCPPQVRIADRRAARDVMMVRPLTARGTPSAALVETDALFWNADTF